MGHFGTDRISLFILYHKDFIAFETFLEIDMIMDIIDSMYSNTRMILPLYSF